MLYDLKITLRKILKNKTFSVLIIAGLSLAFCVAIPLACNVAFNRSFDRFHQDSERIYNVYMDEVYHGTKDVYGELPLAFGEIIRQIFPEVEGMTRTKDESEVLVSVDFQNSWKEDVLWVDPSFKDVFYLDLLAGDKRSFLTKPNEACISESLSRKIFGDLNSVGKTIKINETNCTVSGIFKDYPRNSHLKFSVLISLISRIPDDSKYPYDSYEFLTYVKLREHADSKAIENKMQVIISDYVIPWLKQNYNLDYAFDKDNSMHLKLLPVRDIHLQGTFVSSFEKESNASVIYVNLAIILVLLLIAYFNVMGFTISKGKRHQLQHTIKRLFGVSRVRQTKVFILENLSYTGIAFILSVLLISVIWKYNQTIMTDVVTVPFIKYLIPVSTVLLFAIVMAVVSGIIQSLFFNKLSFKTSSHSKTTSTQYGLNRLILVFQIAASIVLLVCIIGIFKQIKFLSEYDMGLNAENVMIINRANRVRNQYDAFKNELKKSPQIREVSRSNSYPFNWMTTSSFTLSNSQDKYPYPFYYFRTDIGFQDVLDFKMVEGRWFSSANSKDNNAVILNKAAVKSMELKDPLGSVICRTDMPAEKYQVIGVVEDFNFQTLHHSVEPLLLRPMNSGDYWTFIEIKGNNQDREQLIASAKQAWEKIAGDEYFDYTFLEDKIALLYEKERKMKESISLFCVIAILISCFGLLGTVLNTTTEKIKEIGIRKVNGAQVIEIMAMVNKDFIKWVSVAFIIACPIAWYALHKWLQNFAYKTTLSWWVFAAAGAVAVAVALLTVSWQSWRAATRNPVEALRYE
ncbi:MAG: ABC transporter permease [Bacteroidales bacterium]